MIASDIGGLGEVVEHNRTGLLVPPGDAIALADAMRMLWHDDDLCRDLGLAGYTTARDRFTPDAFYRELKSLWSDLLAAPAGVATPALA